VAIDLSGHSQLVTEKNKQAHFPEWLIDIDGWSKYYGTRTVLLGGNNYVGKLVDPQSGEPISAIAQKIDRITGFDGAGNTVISIANAGGSATSPSFESDLLNGKHVANETVRIYLIFDDGTALVDGEKLEIFNGKINSVSMISSIFAIQCENSKRIIYVDLPKNKLGIETYPNMDDSNAGKPIQYIIGDFVTNGYAPASVCIDESKRTYVVADNIMNSLSHDSAYVWCKELKDFFSLTLSDGSDFDGDVGVPATVTLGNNIITQINSIPKIEGTQTNVDDYDYAINGNTSNYFTLNDTEKLLLRLPQVGNDFGVLSDANADYKFIVEFGTLTGGGKVGEITFYDTVTGNYAANPESIDDGVDGDDDGGSGIVTWTFGGDANFTKQNWEFLSRLEFGVKGENAGDSIQIKNMYFEIDNIILTREYEKEK